MSCENARRMIEEFFNGQYEVRKFLGEGSFSDVYLVKHKFLDDLRAMKIIKEPLKSSSNTKDIFHEVKLATQLRHENIISIYDAGIISDTDDFAYFVMEYVPGGDLEQYLNSFINSDIQMPISSVLNLMKQILDGLNVLHSANPPIVHRDLKLNNILLNYNACGDIVIKIADFGFAKEVTTGISDIDIVGTRPYMAPECFNKTSSTMTDIYAVGVIFYKLLSSHYPYDVDKFNISDLLDLKPWNAMLVKPSEYNERIPKRLDEIVMKCLEVKPQDRYQNAGELLGDIELLIDEVNLKKGMENLDFEEEYDDDYSDYVINDSLNEAFKLSKMENGLDEAIEILEKEVLRDYNIRKHYGETLRMWKSRRPDVKLISKAFTVNLKAKNYRMSCNLLKEAIAYNPTVKNKYQHYFRLWNIFIELASDRNLIKAVISLEELMQDEKRVHDIYKDIISILKTYSIEEILNESLNLINANNLVGGANLMEFAVVYDNKIRQEYEYKLSLWKQNMGMYYGPADGFNGDTVDYAIDLGTTDSIVSFYNNGKPTIIKNHITGEDFTPSAVLINDEGNIQVGKAARDALINNNDNAISEFKHNMGFPLPFRFKNSSKSLFPEELSAEVLKDLRLSVYRQCNFNMDHAVICVPANSNPMKTKAIMDAAELAGFRSYNLIFEPVAVAMAYGLKPTPDEKGMWMIYDFGGGTFNVSIIRDNNGVIEKLATEGLDNFGGNSLDWIIVDGIFAPKVINDLHLNDFRKSNSKYKSIFSKLKKAAEKAKIELSDYSVSEICIKDLFEDYDFEYSLERDDYKELIRPYVKKTFDLCHNLLNKNSFELDDLDKIILVGGSSLSPIIRDLICEEFDLPLEFSINPLTVVAMGAAIYAGSLSKPKASSAIDEVSVILNHEDYAVHGRLFCLDDKASFLGFEIEFINEKTGVKKRVPVNIDGEFSIGLSDDEYGINVYCEDDLVRIDEKSPNGIESNMIHIPFLEKSFHENEFELDGLIREYSNLVKSIDYFKNHYEFDDDILEYLDRLMEISQSDKNAFNQTGIYLEYLKGIVNKYEKDFEFSKLLSNVENKLHIMGKEIDLKEIIENRDYDGLKDIHHGLVEDYVSLNRNKVIEEVFFNMRYFGIFDENKEKSDELIKNGLVKLASQDFKELYRIVKELYQIDERS